MTIFIFGCQGGEIPESFTINTNGNTATISTNSTSNKVCSDNSVKVLLGNGQSRMNSYMGAMMNTVVSERDPDAVVIRYNKGGHQMKHWMEEDGTQGWLWPIMMDTFYTGLDAILADGKEICDILLLQVHGSADSGHISTHNAIASGIDSPYVAKLDFFLEDFRREIYDRYLIKPKVTLALTAFDQSHPTFINSTLLTSDSVAKIRNEIRSACYKHNYAECIDTPTDPDKLSDHVHQINGGEAQRKMAEDALDAWNYL